MIDLKKCIPGITFLVDENCGRRLFLGTVCGDIIVTCRVGKDGKRHSLGCWWPADYRKLMIEGLPFDVSKLLPSITKLKNPEMNNDHWLYLGMDGTRMRAARLGMMEDFLDVCSIPERKWRTWIIIEDPFITGAGNSA